MSNMCCNVLIEYKNHVYEHVGNNTLNRGHELLQAFAESTHYSSLNYYMIMYAVQYSMYQYCV